MAVMSEGKAMERDGQAKMHSVSVEGTDIGVSNVKGVVPCSHWIGLDMP